MEAVLLILEKRKVAVGWKMSDIQGISSALYMHKINMEDGYKKSAQQQRRLNPLMKDMVRKEVIKWLDAGMMYPISDSKWVSPVQCTQERWDDCSNRRKKMNRSPQEVSGW